MRTSLRIRRGFTLIELLVVIAILAVLAAVSYPIFNKLSAGDLSTCRSNLEALDKLGKSYSQDMAAHRKGKILPTSGMLDDPSTKGLDESIGWWVELSRADSSSIRPTKKGAPLKVDQYFHCSGDKRADVSGVFEATPESISYVSWTDASQDRGNPNSAILTTAKQDLDNLPWLSDGIPVKGKSVTDAKSFQSMVMPALTRHDNTILVLYASGVVKAFQLEEDADANETFKRIAPALKEQKGKRGSRSKKVKEEPVEEDPVEEDIED